MKITYHGHSAFEIKADKYNIIIDPFLNGNKHAKIKPSDVKADYIVLTHAHGDHLGDTFEIAKKNNATIIAVFELAEYLSAQDYNAHGMHIGGGHNFPFGRLKFTIAHHGSVLEEAGGQYMGQPAGALITAR